MPFDWKEFLDLARALNTQGGSLAASSEAVYRCALGRAYFAAYGHAHSYSAKWLQFVPSKRLEEKSKDHGRLRAHLRDRRRAAVAKRLEELREWRNECDYIEDLGDLDFPSRLNAALEAAAYVFQGLTPPKGATPNPSARQSHQ